MCCQSIVSLLSVCCQCVVRNLFGKGNYLSKTQAGQVLAKSLIQGSYQYFRRVLLISGELAGMVQPKSVVFIPSLIIQFHSKI